MLRHVVLFDYKGKPYRLTTLVRQLAALFATLARTDKGFGAHVSPIIVLAEPRTGSEMFSDMLESTGTVTALGEVLNPWTSHGLPPWIKTPWAMRWIRRQARASAKRPLIKLMLHHLRWRLITIESLTSSFSDSLFVLLYRRDLLRQLISAERLQQTGVHRIASDTDRNEYVVSIDAEHFNAYAQRLLKDYNAAVLGLRAGDAKFCTLCYEDLAEDPQTVIETAIFPHIDAQRATLQSRTRKQSTQAPEEAILNWLEIRDQVVNSMLSFDGRAFCLLQRPSDVLTSGASK